MPRDAFAAAMKELPDTADPEEEINWIRSHPAMSRLARTGAKKVSITVKDIKSTNVGPAPSKSAVMALCTWANMPDKFYHKLLQEHAKAKKEEGVEDSEDEVVEHSLADLKKQIAKAIAHRKHSGVSHETPVS